MTENKIKKGVRTRTGNNKKWIQEEENVVLEYLKSTIESNKKIEKPTVNSYYEEFKKTTSMLRDCPVHLIAAKVKNMKNQYMKAMNWLKSTGAGVDQGTISGYLNKICPNFDALNEIYSDRPNVVVTVIYDTLDESEMFVEEYIDDTIDCEILINEDIDVVDHVDDPVPEDPMPISSIPDPITGTIRRRSSAVKKPNFCNNAISQLKEIQNTRLEMQKQQIELEKLKFKSDVQFKEKQLELEESRIKVELEKIQSQERLKILEFEKQERLSKYELDLKYQKNSN